MNELRMLAFNGPGWMAAIAAIVLLMMKPRSRGRGLLIGSLAIQLALSVRSPLMFFLLSKELTPPESFRSFFESWQLFSVCAGTLSFVLLLLYVFQLLDRSEASLGRTLFNFKGRTGRRTFWVMLIAAVALSIPGYVHQWLAQSGQAKILVPDILAYVLFSPPALIVSLAAQVKRWHDRDKSGWLVLVNFIPIAGAIWTIVELGFLRGTNGANKFGPQPEPAPEVPQGDPA